MNLEKLTTHTGADVVIAKREGEFNTFFPDVVRLQDGRIAVAFYSSKQHMHTPDSRIQLTWGSPDGARWSAPRSVVDVPGFDDRDPSITQLSNGRLLINWFRRDPEDVDSADHGVMVIVSDDGGESWSHPDRVPSALARAAVTAPPLELTDGTLLMPIYGYLTVESDLYELRIAISHDHGLTWSVEEEIAPSEPLPDGTGLVEPTLASLGGDELLIVARSRNHPKNSAFALWSRDAGRTWSVPAECDFAGHAPHLLPVAEPSDTGAPLLMTWGEYAAHDTSTRPVHARLVDGRDRALSGPTVVLYENPATRDMSYPSSVLLADGSILTVYYDAEAGCIAGTRTEVSREH